LKAVILAGGFGTRISEESGIKPKPMVEIGGRPILWHIMKHLSAHGVNEFIVLCGYKSHIIKEYFANYSLYRSDVTFDVANHSMHVHKNGAENWKVTLVETGDNTMTGGRIKKAKEYIGDETFILTYGDGVSDVDIKKLIEFHRKHKRLGTVTAVQPGGRFGVLSVKGNSKVTGFREKSKEDGGWVNGGYLVLEPEVLDYIDGDATVWEQEPMKKLASEGNLKAYFHEGFWQCMDTLRDKNLLESFWQSGKAPWKIWR
jgi:glucose-1-phosphate cytidylyltransferase